MFQEQGREELGYSRAFSCPTLMPASAIPDALILESHSRRMGGNRKRMTYPAEQLEDWGAYSFSMLYNKSPQIRQPKTAHTYYFIVQLRRSSVRGLTWLGSRCHHMLIWRVSRGKICFQPRLAAGAGFMSPWLCDRGPWLLADRRLSVVS